MNYRREREHDELLIALVKALDAERRMDIFCDVFAIEQEIGHLRGAWHRRPFDVEFAFSELSVTIETKVDSDEGGRWGRPWQTEKIAAERAAKGPCFFITYGTSEFYTKPCGDDYRIGPASPQFRHIPLNTMIHFVDTSLRSIKRNGEWNARWNEWLRAMRLENEKRRSAASLLGIFANYRRQYLRIHDDNDFPRGRVSYCAPELAFPVFSDLAECWSRSEYGNRFGRLAVYPVARGYAPVVDSVCNFREMWRTGPVLAADVVDKKCLYIEINEDFNLNLKMKIQDEPASAQKEEIWRRLRDAQWPPCVHARQRNYRQQVFVLYEMDFGFLEHLEAMQMAVHNLGATVEALVDALNLNEER